MERKETVQVDYSTVQSRGELHAILRDALGWPEWYGCNLDAMDDILYDEELPQKILFLGAEQVLAHPELGDYFRRMLDILDGAQKAYQEDGRAFAYELQ